MKTTSFSILFSLFFFVVYGAPNNFTGVWKGTSIEYKSPLEVIFYIKQLSNGNYTGIVVQTAKGAWIQKNTSVVSVFDKKQTVKKKMFGYTDVNGRLKLQEILLFENDTKFDWILDTYSFALSEENGKLFLKSPLLRIGNFEMKLILSQESTILPIGIDQQLISSNPFVISNLSYASKSIKKNIFLYNDSARVTFNVVVPTNFVLPSNIACLVQANTTNQVFANYQTNKLLQQFSSTTEQSNFNIHTSYFNGLDSVQLKIFLFKTFGRSNDTFFVSTNQLSIPAESFFKTVSIPAVSNILSERLKAVGYIYGIQKGDAANGIKTLDNLVLKGDLKARMWRAICYGNGIGSEENEDKAINLATIAYTHVENLARNGDPEAMYLLFNAYLLLNKSDNEKKFGFSLLTKSADKEFPLAAYDLSRFLFLQKKYLEATKYAQQAYAKGISAATVIIGQSYENGLNVKKDIQVAQDWYKKGIIAGNTDAMMAMAMLYNKGKDVTPDISKALTLFKQAAAKNNTSAMMFLGNIYLKGNQGVATSGTIALEWFKKAASFNRKEGMLALGLLYANGSSAGVIKDEKSAFYWTQKAAVAGESDAMTVLSKFYKDGIGTEQNIIASRFWYIEGKNNRSSTHTSTANATNLADLQNFWDYADFSPTYYIDTYSGDVYSSGPDIMGGIFSGIIGSYAESRGQEQEQINDMELMYEQKGKKVYGGTVSSSFKSEIKFNKGQQLKIQCKGAMKLGWMLSGISPNGTQGYEGYSINPQIQHGAFILRVNNGQWLYVGSEMELTIPEDCYLQIAVNDKDYTNNVGYYDFKVISQ